MQILKDTDKNKKTGVVHLVSVTKAEPVQPQHQPAFTNCTNTLPEQPLEDYLLCVNMEPLCHDSGDEWGKDN